MPIEIIHNTLEEVVRQIADFECRYGMKSSDLAARYGEIPEFDAIEWDFLIMQRDALRDDANNDLRTHRAPQDFSDFESDVTSQEARYIYDRVAA